MSEIWASKKINAGFYAALVVWLLFAIAFYHIHSKADYLQFENLSSSIEIFFDVAIVFFSWKVYTKINADFKRYAFLLLCSFVGMTLTDIGFYYVFYILEMNTPPTLYAALYTGPFFFFLICQLGFWFALINQKIFADSNKLYTILLFTVLSFLSMSVFLMASTWKVNYFSFLGLYDVITGLVEFVIFNLVILIMICSTNKGLNFLASGTIIIIATNFWEKYLFDGGKLGAFDYSDVFWFLGLIFILFGLFFLSSGDNKNVSEWIGSLRKIKSQISLWIFSLITFSFLALCCFGYSFGLISKNSLMSLSFLIMVYAVVIVLISSYIGRKFEQPFEKLKNDIEILTDANSLSSTLSQDLGIEEFVFLQKFIVNAFEVQEERNKERKTIADLALQVAHDIRSPVSAILMLSQECVELPETQRTTLRDAATRIQDIANYLLSHYDNITDKSYKTSSFLASAAILSVLSEKRVEYKNRNISFSYEATSNDAAFTFIQVSLSDFKSMLSNIINNSVESIDTQGKIMIKLVKEEANLIVKIIDNGKGMPKDMVNNLLAGKSIISNKTGSHGLGLAHAQKILKKHNAYLNILSTMNIGTEIDLVFQALNTPIWITSEIDFYPDDHILILDDDTSIHGAWDAVFSPVLKKYDHLQLIHFTKGKECIDYITNCKDKNKILLLVDYELIQQGINGLDIIEASGVDRAVLVTSHDENSDIIKRAILLNTKVLPKTLAPAVNLQLVKVPPQQEEEQAIDLVLLEDNQEFSSVLSYLYRLRGKNFALYHNPYELLENLKRYDKETKICLDYDLNCPITGIELAKTLSDKGYHNLYLATGFHMKQEDLPPYITLLQEKMALLNL